MVTTKMVDKMVLHNYKGRRRFKQEGIQYINIIAKEDGYKWVKFATLEDYSNYKGNKVMDAKELYDITKSYYFDKIHYSEMITQIVDGLNNEG